VISAAVQELALAADSTVTPAYTWATASATFQRKGGVYWSALMQAALPCVRIGWCGRLPVRRVRR
jgi:hypothetical protein